MNKNINDGTYSQCSVTHRDHGPWVPGTHKVVNNFESLTTLIKWELLQFGPMPFACLHLSYMVDLSTTEARASSGTIFTWSKFISYQIEKFNWLCPPVALTPKSISASHLQPITLRLLDIEPTICHISIMYEVCYSILICHWNNKQLSLLRVSLTIYPPEYLYFL